MKEKILVITGRDFTEYGMIGRMHYFIRYLAQYHDIIVFNHPQYWKEKIRQPSREYKSFFPSNVEIIDAYPVKIGDAYLNEIVNFIPNIYKLQKLLKNENIKLIINYANLPFGALSTFWNDLEIPIIVDFADYYPGQVGYSTQSKLPLKKLASLIVKLLMDTTLKSATKITACSSLLSEYAKKVSLSEVYLIPNGADFSEIVKGDENIREKYGISEDDIVLGYLGTIHDYLMLDIAIESLDGIQKEYEEVKLMIAGDGPYLEKLEEKAEKLDAEDVIFAGRVKKKDKFKYINSFDICLNLFKINPLTKPLRPLKLFEYWACGKPVISTPLPELLRHYPDDSCTIIYVSDKEEFIAETLRLIDRMKKDPITIRKKLRVKQNEIRSFDWMTLSEKFYHVVCEI